jgi:hypothetical protein
MQKRIWLSLIASSIFLPGLPGPASAQISGAGPEAVTPGDTNPEIVLRRYARDPFLVLRFSRRPASLANQGVQSNGVRSAQVAGAAYNGNLTPFDAPGSGTGEGQGTFAYSINPAGGITGYYVDGPEYRGFILTKE